MTIFTGAPTPGAPTVPTPLSCVCVCVCVCVYIYTYVMLLSMGKMLTQWKFRIIEMAM